jgi:hypothetical protein
MVAKMSENISLYLQYEMNFNCGKKSYCAKWCTRKENKQASEVVRRKVETDKKWEQNK